MPSQSWPDGVQRWEAAQHLGVLSRTAFATMIEDLDGEYVRLSDLPKIEAAAVERKRERLVRVAVEDWPSYGLAEAAAELAYDEAGEHPRAMAAAIRAAIREVVRQDFPGVLAALDHKGDADA